MIEGQTAVRQAASNHAYTPFPPEAMQGSMVDRFENIARLYGERLAVTGQGEALTYDALNRWANRLARAIVRRRGAEQEPVVLLLSSSVRIPVAIFGVAKSRHFYVPLDPATPALRLLTMIRDAGATLMIVDDDTRLAAEQLRVDGGIHDIINIDMLDTVLDETNLKLAIARDDLLLRYYTSGTTGQPKAMMGTHHQSLYRTRDNTDLLRITADDRFAHLVSYSFAASRKVLFDALLNGASVYLYSTGTDGVSGLAAWLANEEITLCCATPSLFRRIAAAAAPGMAVPVLRLIFVTGEPVHQHDLILYRRLFSDDCLFVNMFGATETGAICQFMLDKQTIIDGTIVPVGVSVHGNTITLVDEDGSRVANGDVGEFVVQGPHIAPNIWRDDPPNSAFRRAADGSWAYYTGDLGRLRPDGLYEHLGRRDFQVKINGQRIEPAEVEAALLQHDAVRAAVVLALSPNADPASEKRLAAYLVADTMPTIPELRQFLAARLPRAMIPSAFVQVDAIPLAVGGKVDRGALPPPQWSQRALNADPIVEPGTWVEERLILLWAEALGLDEVSVEDNFFDLGGTSLTAASVLSGVERDFGKTIPLATLERFGTARLLAAYIKGTGTTPPRSTVLRIKATGTRPTLFCAPGVGGYAYPYFPMARRLNPDQPVFAFQQRGLDANEPMPQSVEEIARTFISDMRAVQPYGPYALCGRSFGGLVAYEMAQQLRAAGEMVSILMLLDTAFCIPKRRKPYAYFVLLTVYHVLRALALPRAERWTAQRARLRLLRARTRDQFGQARPLRLKRANLQLARQYAILPYVGPIEYFSAQDRARDAREVEWARVATGGLTVHAVPGNHISMAQPPHVAALANAINQRLDALEQDVL